MLGEQGRRVQNRHVSVAASGKRKRRWEPGTDVTSSRATARAKKYGAANREDGAILRLWDNAKTRLGSAMYLKKQTREEGGWARTR
jgi:hypothetical protein